MSYQIKARCRNGGAQTPTSIYVERFVSYIPSCIPSYIRDLNLELRGGGGIDENYNKWITSSFLLMFNKWITESFVLMLLMLLIFMNYLNLLILLILLVS